VVCTVLLCCAVIACRDTVEGVRTQFVGGYPFTPTERRTIARIAGATALEVRLGAGFSVFNRGKHNLQVGFQYAPAFTDPGTVHSIGFTFGYQFQ
jgi:hypothetical protein